MRSTGDWNDPAVLVSQEYLGDRVIRVRHRRWVLDSGAFTAWRAGKSLRLADYIDLCHDLLASDDPPAMIFGLDVIGDWEASRRNVREMWAAGIEAIPTYHVGSPERWLMECAREYPKMALGGMVGMQNKRRLDFIEQVFARVWPARIHGFGLMNDEVIDRFPFHSLDATSWNRANKYGLWSAYGYKQLSARGVTKRAEFEHFMRLERRFIARWARVFEAVEKKLGTYAVPREMYFAAAANDANLKEMMT